MFTKGAWNADDEMEYLRQEQLRVEKRHENAFKEGFGLGAVWGITNGVKALADVFAKTADCWENYPPELVRSFAASMVENIPAIEKVLLDGIKKDGEKNTARRNSPLRMTSGK